MRELWLKDSRRPGYGEEEAYIMDDSEMIIHNRYGLFVSCVHHLCKCESIHWHRCDGVRVWGREMMRLEKVILIGMTEEQVARFGENREYR